MLFLSPVNKTDAPFAHNIVYRRYLQLVELMEVVMTTAVAVGGVVA